MPIFLARMTPRRRFHADRAAVLDRDPGHFAILHDIDAALGGRARIAPDHGIVARRAAARLHQAAMNGKARIVVVQIGQEGANALAVEKLAAGAVQPHGVAAPGKGVALSVGVINIDDAALADHRVVVEVPLQALPELHRPFVEAFIAGQQIIGADDGRVASGIAGADPVLFQHGDIGDAVHLGEIMRGGEAVAAAADNDHVVGRFRRRIAPGRPPVLVTRQRVPGERPTRIMHSGTPSAQQSSVVWRSHSVRWRE